MSDFFEFKDYKEKNNECSYENAKKFKEDVLLGKIKNVFYAGIRSDNHNIYSNDPYKAIQNLYNKYHV